jgi:demethylmenaquinone methyltransferase/2-methoxy-6-polyprenyl-1,4-benzoquinol methylase
MKEKDPVHEAFTELAPRYEQAVDQELETFWGWSYQDFIDQLIKQVNLQDDHRLLDIATGTAVIPRKLAARFSSTGQLFGLDITEAMLRRGQEQIAELDVPAAVHLTCGDAMALPFPADSFDIVVTGLASHHMDIPRMMGEIKRILKPGGSLAMIDVGSTAFWRLPVIRFISRIFAFGYFLFTENISRAWAEAQAVTNVLAPDEWQLLLNDLDFGETDIQPLPSKYAWLPEPLSLTTQLLPKE